MDTYTHVQDKHKIEAMSLMEELYTQASQQNYTYPVVITTGVGGLVSFTAPDSPGIVLEGVGFGIGVQLYTEKLQDEVLTMFQPPLPTPPEQISLGVGQMLLQVAVK